MHTSAKLHNIILLIYVVFRNDDISGYRCVACVISDNNWMYVIIIPV